MNFLIYSRKNEEAMPHYNNKYKGINIEERLKEESVMRKEDRFSIFINDTKTRLSVTDGHDSIEDKMLDFHTFWKGEGNVKSIRETRGISLL